MRPLRGLSEDCMRLMHGRAKARGRVVQAGVVVSVFPYFLCGRYAPAGRPRSAVIGVLIWITGLESRKYRRSRPPDQCPVLRLSCEMAPDRRQTLFGIRYAVRVLEREALLWRRIATILKTAALLSGTVALAALAREHLGISVVLGLSFAILQAVEHAVGPADRRACAVAQRLEYAHLYARRADLDDVALSKAYDTIVAADELIVSRPLRELAYNDIVEEMGLDSSGQYKEVTLWARLLTT